MLYVCSMYLVISLQYVYLRTLKYPKLTLHYILELELICNVTRQGLSYRCRVSGMSDTLSKQADSLVQKTILNKHFLYCLITIWTMNS